MSRYGDVKDLINDVSNKIEKISAFYEEAKQDESKVASFNVDVKNTLENLRSALDYMALDIAEFTGLRGRYVYFPYGYNENDFKSSLGNSFPKLRSRYLDIYNALESFQPHKSGDSIIPEMCVITNDNKHNNLAKYIRINSKEATTNVEGIITFAGDSNCKVELTNVRTDRGIIGANNKVEFNSKMTASEISKVISIPLKVSKEFAWVKFEIDGKSLDVLEFLRKCHSTISQVIVTVYGFVPK